MFLVAMRLVYSLAGAMGIVAAMVHSTVGVEEAAIILLMFIGLDVYHLREKD